VALGWRSTWGYPLAGKTKDRAWSVARSALTQVKSGDFVVVHLHGNRVGRIGEVVRKEADDHHWAPTVPPTKEDPDGEQGRRILVRWSAEGPLDPESVVQLDDQNGFAGAFARQTMVQLSSAQFEGIRAVVAAEANWCRYGGGFSYERSLSDYIASYPHRLEDGLQPYPNVKLREKVFGDGSRADVVLMDRDRNPVVVECKQGPATVSSVRQLRKYMKRVADESGHPTVRGILVHGGARRLSPAVSAEIPLEPVVTVLRYRVDVAFDPSS